VRPGPTSRSRWRDSSGEPGHGDERTGGRRRGSRSGRSSTTRATRSRTPGERSIDSTPRSRPARLSGPPDARRDARRPDGRAEQDDGQKLGGKSAEAARFILRAISRELDNA
jgi:hypothetical protein